MNARDTYEVFSKELNEAVTLNDVFVICNKFYDCQNTKLTFMQKLVVKAGIQKAIELIQPRPC